MMQHYIEMQFDEIEDFSEFIKSAIAREKTITARRIEKEALRLDEKFREEYYEIFSEDYQKIGDIFEKLAMESLIIILFSIIEGGMVTLCNSIRHDKNINKHLKIKSCRQEGYLEKTKNYLQKDLGVDLLLGSNQEWREIIGLQAIRNAVAHNKGWLNTKNSTLRKHYKNGLIEIRHQEEDVKRELSGRVRVKSEYVDHILPQIRKFFHNIKVS